MKGATGDGGSYGEAAFNGLRFSGLGAGGPWGSASIATDIPGLDSSRVTFDGSTLLVNLQNLPTTSTSEFTVTLSPVPEPSTLLLLAAGLAIIGLAARPSERMGQASL
jgi:hypothetical protein